MNRAVLTQKDIKEYINMNESIKLEKVKKSFSVTSKVVKICKIIFIVAAVLCLAGGIACMTMYDTINTGVINLVGIENPGDEIIIEPFEYDGLFEYTFKFDEWQEAGEYGYIATAYCFIGFAITLVATIFFHIIEKIFKVINESETPFCEAVVKKLRTLFIVITILAAILSGIGTAVFMGLFCWCVYTIFDYGYVIQKQVDETL